MIITTAKWGLKLGLLGAVKLEKLDLLGVLKIALAMLTLALQFFLKLHLF